MKNYLRLTLVLIIIWAAWHSYWHGRDEGIDYQAIGALIILSTWCAYGMVWGIHEIVMNGED